jgi:hypothetical protein
MVVGQCAAASENWARAEEHHRTALLQAEEIRTAQPEVRVGTRGCCSITMGAGDRDEARELLMLAIEGYRRVGMPRYLKMVQFVLQT